MPDDFSGPNRFARDLFDPLPARYDRLAEILSFGQNGRWRSAMVDRVPPGAGNEPGSEQGVILDVASGTAGRPASRRAAAITCAVLVAVPEGASSLSGWCSSMTSTDS